MVPLDFCSSKCMKVIWQGGTHEGGADKASSEYSPCWAFILSRSSPGDQNSLVPIDIGLVPKPKACKRQVPKAWDKLRGSKGMAPQNFFRILMQFNVFWWYIFGVFLNVFFILNRTLKYMHITSWIHTIFLQIFTINECPL